MFQGWWWPSGEFGHAKRSLPPCVTVRWLNKQATIGNKKNLEPARRGSNPSLPTARLSVSRSANWGAKKNLWTREGARTPDHEIKSLALCQLSYTGWYPHLEVVVLRSLFNWRPRFSCLCLGFFYFFYKPFIFFRIFFCSFWLPRLTLAHNSLISARACDEDEVYGAWGCSDAPMSPLPLRRWQFSRQPWGLLFSSTKCQSLREGWVVVTWV